MLIEGSHITFLELTVPFEVNASAAHQRKQEKYANLLQNAKESGWIPKLHCIEMGSRGIPCPGWMTWASQQHLQPKITQECAEIALRASHTIWLLKDTVWPQPPLLRLGTA